MVKVHPSRLPKLLKTHVCSVSKFCSASAVEHLVGPESLPWASVLTLDFGWWSLSTNDRIVEEKGIVS